MVENVGKKCLFEEMCILSNDNYQCLASGICSEFIIVDFCSKN
jgi:hypothetical protein